MTPFKNGQRWNEMSDFDDGLRYVFSFFHDRSGEKVGNFLHIWRDLRRMTEIKLVGDFEKEGVCVAVVVVARRVVMFVATMVNRDANPRRKSEEKRHY